MRGIDGTGDARGDGTADGQKAHPSETIKQAPQRIAASSQAIQKAGGRIIGAYATLGRYDYVFITELPDNKAGWPVLVQIAMQGTVSGETMEAIPVEEFVQIINKA